MNDQRDYAGTTDRRDGPIGAAAWGRDAIGGTTTPRPHDAIPVQLPTQLANRLAALANEYDLPATDELYILLADAYMAGRMDGADEAARLRDLLRAVP